MKWSRKAADQGVISAQLMLALLYLEGQGVPQDYVQAHLWYNLAGAGGSPAAAEGRDSVAAKMTPAQIAEAQKLAREWKPKKP
jgi:TPR repeat protein